MFGPKSILGRFLHTLSATDLLTTACLCEQACFVICTVMYTVEDSLLGHRLGSLPVLGLG